MNADDIAEYERRDEVIEAMRTSVDRVIDLIENAYRQRDDARAQVAQLRAELATAQLPSCGQGHDVTRISCEDAAAVRAQQSRALGDES